MQKILNSLYQLKRKGERDQEIERKREGGRAKVPREADFGLVCGWEHRTAKPALFTYVTINIQAVSLRKKQETLILIIYFI